MIFYDLKIHLRPLERRDLPRITNWLLSNDFRANNLSDYPRNKKAELKNQLLKEITISKFIYSKKQLLVAETDSDILVGLAMLNKINWHSRNLDLQLYIPTEFKSTNISLIVTEQIYGYIFNQLNMHKAYLYISGANKSALENHKKNNHEPEAVLYDYLSIGKNKADLHIYAIYKKDIVKKKN